MDFRLYPLDTQTCLCGMGSRNMPDNLRVYSASYDIHQLVDKERWDNSQIKLFDLTAEEQKGIYSEGNFSIAGFRISFQRHTMPFILAYYLPCAGMVVLSWLSFIIPPSAVPGRITLLVTLFLVLISYFGTIQVQ